MKLLLSTLLAMFLFIPSVAMPQVSCFAYGSGPGSLLSCDGPRGNTTIAPLSKNQGIIQGDRDGQSFMEPYTIFPSSPRRDESFSSRPIEPLNRLDRLNRLDSFEDRRSRDRDPLNDPLLPLLLGE